MKPTLPERRNSTGMRHLVDPPVHEFGNEFAVPYKKKSPNSLARHISLHQQPRKLRTQFPDNVLRFRCRIAFMDKTIAIIIFGVNGVCFDVKRQPQTCKLVQRWDAADIDEHRWWNSYLEFRILLERFKEIEFAHSRVNGVRAA